MKLHVCLLLVFSFAAPAAALTERCEVNGVRLTIYAPDWTWQRQNVNVLFVAENVSGAPRSVQVELALPAGSEDHFEVAGDTAFGFEVEPGATARRAITNIFARDGVPRQVYDFRFRLRCGNEEFRVPYPLRTIRGAVVSSARWALYAPLLVALLWSAVFALVLPRLAARERNAARDTAAVAAGFSPKDAGNLPLNAGNSHDA